MHIGELPEIRVIIESAPGFGHQRAAVTLMQKLRDLGFLGIFDIRYFDYYENFFEWANQYENLEFYSINSGEIGYKLQKLIPGFTPKHIEDHTKDPIELLDLNLKSLRITRLPPKWNHSNGHYERVNFELPYTQITFAPGHNDYADKNTLSQFSTSIFTSLQPTSWHVERFTIKPDTSSAMIDYKMRLSSATPSATFTASERSFINSLDFNTGYFQLLYGLFPGNPFFILDASTVISRVKAIGKTISSEFGKPVFLLIPRKISSNICDYNSVEEKIVDMTKGENFDQSKYTKDEVVLLYTGELSISMFDYLLLKGTNLPPVIEGANSIELCEYHGRSYIHASKRYDTVEQYPVTLSKIQDIHTSASHCLEIEPSYNCGYLYEYIKMFATDHPDLIEYHAQRQHEFMKRGDSVECALQMLEIGANYTDPYTRCYGSDDYCFLND